MVSASSWLERRYFSFDLVFGQLYSFRIWNLVQLVFRLAGRS